MKIIKHKDPFDDEGYLEIHHIEKVGRFHMTFFGKDESCKLDIRDGLGDEIIYIQHGDLAYKIDRIKDEIDLTTNKLEMLGVTMFELSKLSTESLKKLLNEDPIHKHFVDGKVPIFGYYGYRDPDDEEK